VNLSKADAVDRFRAARVARLATVSAEGQPHIVPVTFAVCDDDVVLIAVDHKPKTTTNLKRLRNIKANRHVALLVDEYDDADWTRLWWVRVDGSATVFEDLRPHTDRLEVLRQKYRQYEDHPPTGPLIWIDITAVHGWAYGS
jgi:PPOX class probable F420-dependent enzyme